MGTPLGYDDSRFGGAGLVKTSEGYGEMLLAFISGASFVSVIMWW